jgi:L-ascorbate metabolism protein UlaG (beta-lactamase superfamily)
MMITITYIGGPTAFLEMRGLRFLTDPTFDPAGTEYPTSVYTLHKTESPAIPLERVGRVDAVLLSHDQHFDNLDHAGRKLLPTARKVLTTVAGAERLKGNAIGLAPWQSMGFSDEAGKSLRVTAAPARHGPVARNRGPMIGFVLSQPDAPEECVYVSGDTVLYEGVEEVARRFKIATALLFMGAAVVSQVGPDHLTMTADEAIHAAQLFGDATIVPLHFSGWQHFTESRDLIQQTFATAGFLHRLRWLDPGVPITFGTRET